MTRKKYDDVDVLRLHVKHLDRRMRALERLIERMLSSTHTQSIANAQVQAQTQAQAQAQALDECAMAAVTAQFAAMMQRAAAEQNVALTPVPPTKSDSDSSRANANVSSAVAPLGHIRQRTLL